nr:protein FAF-like, chloroplastic [Ipomoea trifida]
MFGFGSKLWSSFQVEDGCRSFLSSTPVASRQLWFCSELRDNVNSVAMFENATSLVKKSATSLTGKFLEICTESLGSEIGSDCFSSYPSFESGDSADKEKDDHQSPPQHELIFPPFPEEFRAVKHNYSNKSSPRSFPPPLPSLVRGDDKPSVRMHSRRQHGCILEGVTGQVTAQIWNYPHYQAQFQFLKYEMYCGTFSNRKVSRGASMGFSFTTVGEGFVSQALSIFTIESGRDRLAQGGETGMEFLPPLGGGSSIAQR